MSDGYDPNEHPKGPDGKWIKANNGSNLAQLPDDSPVSDDKTLTFGGKQSKYKLSDISEEMTADTLSDIFNEINYDKNKYPEILKNSQKIFLEIMDNNGLKDCAELTDDDRDWWEDYDSDQRYGEAPAYDLKYFAVFIDVDVYQNTYQDTTTGADEYTYPTSDLIDTTYSYNDTKDYDDEIYLEEEDIDSLRQLMEEASNKE